MNDTALIDQKNPVLDFSAMDRCDRCGAQTLVIAERDGIDLRFCGHHIKTHREALEDDGWSLIADDAQWENLYGEPFLVEA